VLEGSKIGDYRILSQLGAGGMGTAWLAEHIVLRRKAAIKVLLERYNSHVDVQGPGRAGVDGGRELASGGRAPGTDRLPSRRPPDSALRARKVP
jgi:serine/threonine protein kinase